MARATALGGGSAVSIGKTVQDSHGRPEAADSVAGRGTMELCVSRVELFHVEQLDSDTQDRLSERSPAARSHLVALTESRQCSTWNISFVRSRHSKAPRYAIPNVSHLTCNTTHKILK